MRKMPGICIRPEDAQNYLYPINFAGEKSTQGSSNISNFEFFDFNGEPTNEAL